MDLVIAEKETGGKQLRRKISYVCFSISSIFKFLGKVVIPKQKTIIVDLLTLPGWFILDNCMIHQIRLRDKKLVGFEWHTYDMPPEWIALMTKLKSKK